MPERQMSEGLLEVLSQRADLALFRSSLLVSGQSGRPAPQIQIIILSLSLYIYIYICGLNCTYFAFIQKHNLTNEMEESSGFTMFAPTDSAIQEYLRRTGKESLVLYKHTKKTYFNIKHIVSHLRHEFCLFPGFECDPVSHYN